MRKFEMTGAAAAAPEGWSAERVASLTKLWTDGLSASQIATRLGVTRNAVIGKVHRLELPARRTTQRAAVRRPLDRGTRGPRPSGHTAERRRGGSLKTLPAPRLRPLPQIEVEPCRIALLDLGEGQCRWPIGDPKEAGFAFCGHPAHRSYCGRHEIAAHSR
ncbi:MAG: GcrA family cell cycle regulator [Pseudomonadota bacterium]|nr:GcrA family cell cycle regulator [Pseudomonadota bacterium]